MAAARREAASHDSADAIISPLVAAGITALPGLLALASGQVLLFPSLGPSAVMQAHSPEHRSSRFYNVVVSHLAGLAAADVYHPSAPPRRSPDRARRDDRAPA
jgi:hypothetical protein